MKNGFDNLINLSKFAKGDSELIKNHIDNGVHTRIKDMLDDVILMIRITVEDADFLSKLKVEKIQLKDALKVYEWG